MLGGKKRFTRKSDDRAHYLVVGSGEPIEIEPGNRFVMGRDPRTSLVVHSGDVSRQHAEITWESDPPMPLINEVRSRNGTFLNNKLVEAGKPQPLRSGDDIRLGNLLTMTYMYVTERALRIELEDRAKSDTRAFDRPAGASSSGAPDEGLGDLVAAALGEADLAPIEAAGDFKQIPGNTLVKRLFKEQKSGVLTVYDSTAVGELILIDGRCQHAMLGVLRGKDALRHVAGLSAGQFRFCPEDPTVLAVTGQPSEVDDQGLALSGDFTQTSGSILVRDLVARKTSGILTVFSANNSGALILERGICQDVQLGTLKEREALDALVRLKNGVFRFRPAQEGSTLGMLSPQDLPAQGYGYDYSEPDPAPPRKTRALRPADDEAGVKRRSSSPMRGATSRQTRRRPPPPPKRRNPPPRY